MEFEEFQYKTRFLLDQIADCKDIITYYKTTDEPFAEAFRNKKITEQLNKINLITNNLMEVRKSFKYA